jgi:opacity protein-like surface antigen
MKTPRCKALTLAGALVASCFVTHTVFAAKFVRAALLHTTHTSSEYSSETGGSLAAGLDWGAARQHELSFEVARSSWSFDRPAGTPGLGTLGDGDVTPLLVNYRYYLGAVEAKFRPYAGGIAGALLFSGDATVSLSGIKYAGSVDETQAVYGAAVGMAGRLSDTVSLDVGYRYLGGQNISAASRLFAGTSGYTGAAGPDIKLPAPSAHLLAVSLTIQF